MGDARIPARGDIVPAGGRHAKHQGHHGESRSLFQVETLPVEDFPRSNAASRCVEPHDNPADELVLARPLEPGINLGQHVAFPVEDIARSQRADHPFDIDDQDLLLSRAFYQDDFLHPVLAQEINPECASCSGQYKTSEYRPMSLHRSSIDLISLYHIFIYAATISLGRCSPVLLLSVPMKGTGGMALVPASPE